MRIWILSEWDKIPFSGGNFEGDLTHASKDHSDHFVKNGLEKGAHEDPRDQRREGLNSSLDQGGHGGRGGWERSW